LHACANRAFPRHDAFVVVVVGVGVLGPQGQGFVWSVVLLVWFE
jgi:hypothetical protein